jgi:hypothetical protein
MTNQSRNEVLKISLLNIWSNKALAVLILVLVGTLIGTPNANNTSRAIAIVAVTVILVKAESRPQPVLIALMAAALCVFTVIGLSQVSSSMLCTWISAFLIVPLAISKWIVTNPSGDPVSRRP